MRILERSEIAGLLDAAKPEHRPLLATLIFAGVRISEALGLRWSDVDLENGQLDHRSREHTDTKTRAARGES
jgi:integrase